MILAVEVSKDEVIGNWLKREYNWEKCKRVFEPTVSQPNFERIVNSNDYTNNAENILRFTILSLSGRSPLLADTMNANWSKITIDAEHFKALRVIADDGWRILSNFSGRLSNVAKLINGNSRLVDDFFVRQRDIFDPNSFPYRQWNVCHETVNIINSMANSNLETLNKNLILLTSNDCHYTTILEGNKTAVAIYIKHFILEESEFTPLQVYIGNLETKSRWQW